MNFAYHSRQTTASCGRLGGDVAQRMKDPRALSGSRPQPARSQQAGHAVRRCSALNTRRQAQAARPDERRRIVGEDVEQARDPPSVRDRRPSTARAVCVSSRIEPRRISATRSSRRPVAPQAEVTQCVGGGPVTEIGSVRVDRPCGGLVRSSRRCHSIPATERRSSG